MARADSYSQLLVIFSLLFTFSCAQKPLPKPLPEPPREANHIFNSILSSMRQFGSSMNHNGMSAFLAHVPADTQFYHGRGSPEKVQGIEWLSFEPEHAVTFAYFLDPPGLPPRPPSDQVPLHEAIRDGAHVSSLQLSMLNDGRDDHPELKPGWLHTYRTKHPLRLIYLDGMSAGKTQNGTLDFEDRVLLRDNSTHRGYWDPERARRLCRIAAEDWAGNIDGFLRMEAGFEVILCDFEQHLDEVHVNRVGKSRARFDENGDGNMFFNYYRAISDRFDGIGGDRVSIYYDDFITAFGRGIDLFANNTTMPRLLNANDTQLAALRSEVDDLVSRSPSIFANVHTWANWQSIADLIVTRYSNRITYLQSSVFSNSLAALGIELDRALTPFIDYENRDFHKEIRTCTTHFLPDISSPSLASDTISAVHAYLCESFFTALLCSGPDAAECDGDPYRMLDELAEYLSWTIWKRCGTCAVDELCSVPTWPYGSLADHERPTCRNASSAWEQRGYWGGRGS